VTLKVLLRQRYKDCFGKIPSIVAVVSREIVGIAVIAAFETQEL